MTHHYHKLPLRNPSSQKLRKLLPGHSRVGNIPHLAHAEEDDNQGAIAQDADHEDQGEQDGHDVGFRSPAVGHVGCLGDGQFAEVLRGEGGGGGGGCSGSGVLEEGPLGGGRGQHGQIPESLRYVQRRGQWRGIPGKFHIQVHFHAHQVGYHQGKNQLTPLDSPSLNAKVFLAHQTGKLFKPT